MVLNLFTTSKKDTFINGLNKKAKVEKNMFFFFLFFVSFGIISYNTAREQMV